METNVISQRLNKTNDTNHIALCVRTERSPELRNFFGYVIEHKYSLGGLPLLNNSVYIDADVKGPCQDIFLDLNKR
jgi:hypothetical protein